MKMEDVRKNTDILLVIPFYGLYKNGMYALMSEETSGKFANVVSLGRNITVTGQDILSVQKSLLAGWIPTHNQVDNDYIITWMNSIFIVNLDFYKKMRSVYSSSEKNHDSWVNNATDYYTRIFSLPNPTDLKLKLSTIFDTPVLNFLTQDQLEKRNRYIAMVVALSFVDMADDINLDDNGVQIWVAMQLASILTATGKISIDLFTTKKFVEDIVGEADFGDIIIEPSSTLTIAGWIKSILDTNPDVKAHIQNMRRGQNKWNEWVNDTYESYKSHLGPFNSNQEKILKNVLNGLASEVAQVTTDSSKIVIKLPKNYKFTHITHPDSEEYILDLSK